MRLYQVTDRSSAQAILDGGFRDTEVFHDNRELQIGVWLADCCLAGENDVGQRLGPAPEVALEVEPSAEAVDAYERREEGKPYRELCVPAELVNRSEVVAVRDLEDIELNERRRRGQSLETP